MIWSGHHSPSIRTYAVTCTEAERLVPIGRFVHNVCRKRISPVERFASNGALVSQEARSQDLARQRHPRSPTRFHTVRNTLSRRWRTRLPPRRVFVLLNHLGTNSGAAAIPREPAINSSIATPKWSFAASVTPVASGNVDNIAPARYIATGVLHTVLNRTPRANWLSADNRLIGLQPLARQCRQLKFLLYIGGFFREFLCSLAKVGGVAALERGEDLSPFLQFFLHAHSGCLCVLAAQSHTFRPVVATSGFCSAF